MRPGCRCPLSAQLLRTSRTTPRLLPACLPAGQEGVKYTPRGLAVAPLEGWGNNRRARGWGCSARGAEAAC